MNRNVYNVLDGVSIVLLKLILSLSLSLSLSLYINTCYPDIIVTFCIYLCVCEQAKAIAMGTCAKEYKCDEGKECWKFSD
jgi:hypothetical protein